MEDKNNGVILGRIVENPIDQELDCLDFYQSLGAAIDSATDALPKGYRLNLEISEGQRDVSLMPPGGGWVKVESASTVDEIERCVQMAIELKAATRKEEATTTENTQT